MFQLRMQSVELKISIDNSDSNSPIYSILKCISKDCLFIFIDLYIILFQLVVLKNQTISVRIQGKYENVSSMNGPQKSNDHLT
jgi:hypothetical protein